MSAVVSKARAMGESAVRTFAQAALPAFGAALYAADGEISKAVWLGAAAAAAAAGLAAIARVLKPIQTDAAGVGVAGVTPAGRGTTYKSRHTPDAGYPDEPSAVGEELTPGPGRTSIDDVPPRPVSDRRRKRM